MHFVHRSCTTDRERRHVVEAVATEGRAMSHWMGPASLRERLKSNLPLGVTSALKGARSSVRALRWRTRRRLQHTLQSGLCVEIASFSDWVVYNEVFVDGEYDPVIDELIESEHDEPWILDVGANVGLFTLRLTDRWLRSHRRESAHHVVCVEGAPSTFRVLAKNLAQPQVESRCTLHLGLAGQRSGVARISTSAHTGVNSIVDRSPSLSRVRMPFLDLTQLVPPNARIALLKCDIEGAEELFLANYPDLLQRVDAAVVELHHQFCATSRCRDLLTQAGLTRHRLLKTYGDDCTLEWFSRVRPMGRDQSGL
jgi:FkbM family methyltransferase